MRKTKYILTFLFIGIFANSCNWNSKTEGNTNPENGKSKKLDNISESFSEDINELSKILDFSIYSPIKVKFKYTFIDNSGQNQRLSVPGPSDYYLEALLYFDSTTMDKFYEFDKNAEYDSPNLKKTEFKFEWLSKEIIDELMNSSPKYSGHPEFFFGSGVNGKAWYLENKILLKTNSN
jgi:hypothetical protein